MTSIEVKDFQFTIMNFIKDYKLPAEVKRLALKEIYEEVAEMAHNEMYAQAAEREAKNA